MSEEKVPEFSTHPQGDPFADLGKLRLSQDFARNAGVRKLLTTVPVRKPNGQEFVRVNPDAEYRINTRVLELKDEHETYLVARELWDDLSTELKSVTIFLAINRSGVVFLWLVKLPDEDGRLDEWNRSARAAAEQAMNSWVRLKSNRELGAYEIFEAIAGLPPPQFPDCDFSTLMKIAFKGRYIASLGHPVIQRLRGEA